VGGGGGGEDEVGGLGRGARQGREFYVGKAEVQGKAEGSTSGVC
jgi:hypothetical protein